MRNDCIVEVAGQWRSEGECERGESVREGRARERRESGERRRNASADDSFFWIFLL